MKVTSRELTLLIVLGSLFLVYILYAFLFTPLINDVLVAKDTLKTAQIQKETVEKHSETIPELIAQQEQTIAEAEKKVENFLPSLHESALSSFFYRTTTNGGPPISGINFGNPEIINLDSLIPQPLTQLDYPYGQYEAIANQDKVSSQYIHPEQGNGDPSKNILIRRVYLNFTTTSYEQVIQQMKLVETLNRFIRVEALAISRNENGLGGNVSYAFLGVDKLSDNDTGIPETKLSESNGRSNPF